MRCGRFIGKGWFAFREPRTSFADRQLKVARRSEQVRAAETRVEICADRVNALVEAEVFYGLTVRELTLK